MNLFQLKTICFFAFTITFNSYAQVSNEDSHIFKDSTSAYLEISGMGSSNPKTPFWIQANQFGTVSRTGPAGTARGQYENFWSLSPNKTSNPWRVGAGVEAVANLTSDETKLLLPQAHATLRFRNWELFVGRKKQYVGLADSSLGTGSYAWSNNAMPIPKIQIGTTKFVPVPFTKGWISFNGFYSEGMFENSRPVTKELRLHQKMLYIRIGKPASRLKLYGGFNHQVQWGGKTPYETVNGTMSRGFHNYKNLVLGKSGADGGDTIPSYFDNSNRVGNHLGTIDLAMEVETFDYSWFIYRQSIYEDGTLYSLGNIVDGLNGIRLKRKNLYGADFSVSEIVVEFLYTKSQGGPKFEYGKIGGKRGSLGRDNYFNNTQVRDGWSYYDRTIGTPFIPPTSDTKWNWPNYGNFYTSNNRVAVAHIGLKGTLLQKIEWTTKLSFSNNIGAYDNPFSPSANQFSGLITMQSRINILGGSIIKGSVAGDIGQLYQNSFGFTLGLRKEFTF